MRQFLSNLSLKCKLQSAAHTTATARKMATIPKKNAKIQLDHAVEFYTTQVETGSANSYHACAVRFGVNQETLHQHIAGRKSQRDASYNMSWVTAEEDQVLINFFIEIAESGFPDTKQYLREHINTLLRARRDTWHALLVSIGLTTGWGATRTSSRNTGTHPSIAIEWTLSTPQPLWITSWSSRRSSMSMPSSLIAYGQWMKLASSSIIPPRSRWLGKQGSIRNTQYIMDHKNLQLLYPWYLPLVSVHPQQSSFRGSRWIPHGLVRGIHWMLCGYLIQI